MQNRNYDVNKRLFLDDPEEFSFGHKKADFMHENAFLTHNNIAKSEFSENTVTWD